MSDDTDKLSDSANELLNETREAKREADERQSEILASIQSEHGGDLIETTFSVTSDHSAPIATKLNGELIDRINHIESSVPTDRSEVDAKDLQNVSMLMDETASLLADIIPDSDFDKTLFYSVYESEGPETLGVIAENAFKAIEREVKRQYGDVDGFRQK